jgi:predicted lipid-binding transport protein (Tim44 family)
MFSDLLDLIILGLVACFVLFKLYIVVGRSEDEQDQNLKDRNKFNFKPSFKNDIIDVTPPSTSASFENKFISSYKLNLSPKIQAVINNINLYDASFSAEYFISGAKKAFEIIINAFSKGDKETLKELLSNNAYTEFVQDIDSRKAKGTTVESFLVKIDSTDIIDAKLNGNMAEITVKYISDQINIIKNEKNEVIAGNPSRTEKIEDIWTFAKDISSEDPNWKLIATGNPTA